MKALNDKATAIFRKLTDGLQKVGDHRKWDNASGTFMAACVEIIGRTGLGPLVSIAHYYLQEGDMMRDPDVVFLVGADQHVYPISYRQDGLGIDQEAAYVDDGKWKVKPKMQADITAFCDDWMCNIAGQQGLDQKIETAFDAADDAHAQTQETLRKVEESLKPKTDEASESRT